MNDSYTHLEDFSEDIIAKAQAGLRITNRDLCESAGIELAVLKDLKNGGTDEAALRKVASSLGLDPDRLVVSAKREWLPEKRAIPRLQRFISHFRSMRVNAYLIVAPGQRAVLFDTGVDADSILRYLAENRISLESIVLTHGHPDHVAVLQPLCKDQEGIIIHAHPAEEIPGTIPVNWGETFEAGPLSLRSLSTPGHSPGGTTFLVEGFSPPLAIVGDALFAGSVGGCAPDYEGALQAIRENILSLPDETILCPGHGPITTVGEENEHNPFFPR